MVPDHKPVGVVGTGLMGMACAKRLLAAGFEVLGYDVDAAKLAGLAAAVAPAPVVRVPFLRSDVHDVAGLTEVAAHLL